MGGAVGSSPTTPRKSLKKAEKWQRMPSKVFNLKNVELW